MVKREIQTQNTTQEWVAKTAGIPLNTLKGWIAKKIFPRLDEAHAIASALRVSVDSLLTGESEPPHVHAPTGKEVALNGDGILIPILPQKVAAGRGQEMIEAAIPVGRLPFLKKMLRGESPDLARALEVRGDSMTGVSMFDGDLVVFVPGVVRGDGIYVLRAGDSLLVKRVEFDEVSRKLRIMSENPRYPDRVESADGQTVEVVGKVFGWVHSHPY